MATGKNGFQYRLLGIRNDINQEKVSPIHKTR